MEEKRRIRLLSGKLRQSVHWATDREGGGYLLPDNQCTKTGRSVAEALLDNQPDTRVLSRGNTTCAAFKEHEEVLETVPLDSTEDDVMWVSSNISGAAGALKEEEIDLRNLLLHFGCAS